MSMCKPMLEFFTYDASLFAREAVRTSLMRSQAVMNFLFVRIYKSANIEYLEKKSKSYVNKCFYKMNDSELDIKRSTLYYLYLIKREKFKQCLRELFLSNSVVTSISKYIKWRREYDAGLATACLMLYDCEESNSFCGRSLKLPIVHRFNVIQKLCNLSEISCTHTTYSDISCTSSEHDPDEYYLNNEEEESIFNEPLCLNQSLSLPSIKMLEPDEINNKNTMYSIKNNLFSDNSIKFNGKTVEFVDTENLSESTN